MTTTITIDRATVEQALEFCESVHGGCTDSDDGTVEAITVWCPELIAALRAALAQQAEPLTIYRLRDALVASRIIPPAAVEDPEGYDDGVTLHRIQGLHRRIT